MTQKTRIVVPDIHGMMEQFQRVLDKVGYNPAKQQWIFLGDYIDRGPDSKSVIETLMKLKNEGAIVLRGNHEGLMLDVCWRDDVYRPREALNCWMWNGGYKTLQSYCKDDPIVMEVDKEHVRFIADLPLWYEDNEYFYSHAPIPASMGHYELAKSSESALTWSYGQPEDKFAIQIPGKMGICGHVKPEQGRLVPRIYPHYAYLDAGCGCNEGAPLVACNLDDKVIDMVYPKGIKNDERKMALEIHPPRWRSE